MVKLTGPSLSTAASGSIGNTLTFSKCKGQNYLRKHAVPANPKTALQISTRCMLRFLSQSWRSIATTPKASWTARAQQLNLSAYHAFLRTNLRRWATFQSPSQTDPSPQTGTQPYATFHQCYGSAGQANLLFKIYTLQDVWGFIIFRSTAPSFPTDPSNALHILPVTQTGDLPYVDSNLQPGTYYYNARHFTTEGLLAAEEGEKTAIVT